MRFRKPNFIAKLLKTLQILCSYCSYGIFVMLYITDRPLTKNIKFLDRLLLYIMFIVIISNLKVFFNI